MTSLIIACVTLSLAVLAAILWPLWRGGRASATRLDYDLGIYRQQLLELDRDHERGLLPDDQLAAARQEIYRRMLAADVAPPAADPPRNRRPYLLSAVIALALPLAAGGIYLSLGAPNLPARPFAERQSDPMMRINAMAEKLAARLAAAPDGEGFRRLGDAYATLKSYDLAARSYERAEKLGIKDPVMLARHGEILVLLADGMVVPEARQLLLTALQGDPTNPLARFYLGLAQAQIGNYRKAVAIWRDLEQASPRDAPWLETLRAQIAEAAQQGGFAADSVTPAPESTGESKAAADQERSIRAMVDGLAKRLQTTPDDFEGWMRLALSYRVLGEQAKGIDAARHAIALKPKEVDPKLALAQLQLGEAPESALPADFIATLREVLALDGENPTALYYLGVAAAAAGNKAAAKQYWQQLLPHLSADMPERADIEKRLKDL